MSGQGMGRDRKGTPDGTGPRVDLKEQAMPRFVIERAYGGSAKALVMHALATKKSSAEDLEAIEKLLERFEGGTK